MGSNSGIAMLGFGYAEGEDRAKKATEKALSSPLLERPIAGARRLLLNVTGGRDLGLGEANQIATMISESSNNSLTEIIFGTVLDEEKGGGVQVTIIATDFIGLEKDKIGKRDGGSEGVVQKLDGTYDDSIDIPAFVRRGIKGSLKI